MNAPAVLVALGRAVLGQEVSPEFPQQVRALRQEVDRLGEQVDALARSAGVDTAEPVTRLSIFHGYLPILVVAFFVTLIATPLMRRLAVAYGIIDRPSEARKVHRIPVAYLGGAAVFLGIAAGILYSYLSAALPSLLDFHATHHEGELPGVHEHVPLSILMGITVIFLIGIADDVTQISPRVKVGGQLLAAAALAIDNVGVKLAAGLLVPMARGMGIPTSVHDGFETVFFSIPLPFPAFGYDAIPVNVIYWIGTAFIAIAVLGLCNASNLIDGLDGLLTGTTAISAAGLLVIALGLALVDDGPRDAQRIVLCLCLLGACLGFLPHNFNPATIFLGDSGSMLMGFMICVIVMTLGDTGKTHLVAAGLIVYALPIMDMALAIVRRKLAGKPISAADDQHLHHMLKRALGVKKAVFVLYAISATFALIGAGVTLIRARSIYALGFFLFCFIGIYAIKIARLRHIEDEAASFDVKRETPPPAGAGGNGIHAAPTEPAKA